MTSASVGFSRRVGMNIFDHRIDVTPCNTRDHYSRSGPCNTVGMTRLSANSKRSNREMGMSRERPQAAARVALARFRFVLARYRPAENAWLRLPRANVAKHSARTRWSSEAPKYCHRAAVGPG